MIALLVEAGYKGDLVLEGDVGFWMDNPELDYILSKRHLEQFIPQMMPDPSPPPAGFWC